MATCVTTTIKNLSHYEANTVTNPITGTAEEYPALFRAPNLKIWTTYFANDLVGIAQGVSNRMPTGNNTIFFIDNNRVTKQKKVTYGRVVAEINPHKVETHHVRLTVGGDILDFDRVTATQCASMYATKILMNSTISTPRSKLMTMYLRYFYHGTPV